MSLPDYATDQPPITGDLIEIEFSRGGWAANARVNGKLLCGLQGLHLDMRAGEFATLSIEVTNDHIPPQRGYFVSESDWAEFATWRSSLTDHRRGYGAPGELLKEDTDKVSVG